VEESQEGSRGGEGFGGFEGGPRGSYIRRPRVCQFCIDQVAAVDYKQPDLLRRFVMERGKIRPRRQTGTCAKHQRSLAVAIKRARHLALLPFVED
jgi:small subunit ribosomal protein S18